MAQLLLKDQENYVPCEGGDPKNILETIVFDGDALTEERARNVQWTFKDGDCPFDRLEGLDPSHADWHVKVKLYEVQHPLVLINLYPLLPGGGRGGFLNELDSLLLGCCILWEWGHMSS